MRGNQHATRMTPISDMRTLTLIFVMMVSLPQRLTAQPSEPDIVVAPEPVGSGARALGQSAFIAVADDATAASWNPAGLINLEEPEASFVGVWKTARNHYSSEDADSTVGPGSWSGWQINFMSYARPIRVGNTDAVLSVNYHQVYDFGLDLDYEVQEGLDRIGVKAASEGAVSAYSLACGLSVPSYPQITIGAGFNWYSQSLLANDFAWQEKTSVWRNSIWGLTRTETFDHFRGYNFTFGVLWDMHEKEESLLTLGFVCHTPFTAEVQRELEERRPAPIKPFWDAARLEMDFPLSFGAGVNYRISDSLSVAFDVEWKDWSEFEQKNLHTGERSSPIGGGEGDIADTLAFRLGGERLAFLDSAGRPVLAYRGGIFCEPRPALDEAMPVYGFSLGLGWTVKERFSLDFAYQFRWGEEVNGANLGRGLPEIDYRIEEHFFVSSLIVYFR